MYVGRHMHILKYNKKICHIQIQLWPRSSEQRMSPSTRRGMHLARKAAQGLGFRVQGLGFRVQVFFFDPLFRLPGGNPECHNG